MEMIATVTDMKMKAILCEKPGPVSRLRVTEIDRPALTDDSLLVRVHASSANPVDMFSTTRAGYLMGGRKPIVLGTDFAGTVEAVGKNVTRFKTGDEVFGGKRGAFADYLLTTEATPMVLKPAGVSFELAGTVAVAASTALQALRKHAGVEAGQRVLINGASGGVGTFAVQIARALGAEVTAVCSSRNVEMVRSLGATTVIDYTKEDFIRAGGRYDAVLNIAATHSYSACKRILKPLGAYVNVGAAAIQHKTGGVLRVLGYVLGTRITALGGRRRVRSLFITDLNNEDLTFLADLLESGKVVPAIERRYDLAGAPEALDYIDTGHARAKLAISI